MLPQLQETLGSWDMAIDAFNKGKTDKALEQFKVYFCSFFFPFT
jgi:hypothetical protein